VPVVIARDTPHHHAAEKAAIAAMNTRLAMPSSANTSATIVALKTTPQSLQTTTAVGRPRTDKTAATTSTAAKTPMTDSKTWALGSALGRLSPPTSSLGERAAANRSSAPAANTHHNRIGFGFTPVPNDKDHRPADAGEARYSGSGASTGWAKVSSWPDKQHLLSVKGHDPKRATDKFDFVNVNATQAEAARRDGVVG